jgi:phenylpyruvate tautomerase PptA (4-oxalocrotonate tautomerase family)
VLHDALGKPLDWSCVAFQEMKRENCGWGVMPVAAFGELQADQASEAGLL